MARHRVVFIHQPEVRTSNEILRKNHRTEAIGHRLYERRTCRLGNGRYPESSRFIW